MSIGKIRRWLYFITKLLGDLNAVRRGRIGQRIGRRITGKRTGRWLGRFFR